MNENLLRWVSAGTVTLVAAGVIGLWNMHTEVVEVRVRLSNLDAVVNQRLDALERRISRMDERLTRIQVRIDAESGGQTRPDIGGQ